MDYRTYSKLWDRAHTHSLHSRAHGDTAEVTFVRLAVLRGKTPRVLRARSGAGPFQRSDMSLRRMATLRRADRIFAACARIRAAYISAACAAEARYGSHGPLVSGVVREHFPPSVKDRLRKLAHADTRGRDFAFALVRATGRSNATARAMMTRAADKAKTVTA